MDWLLFAQVAATAEEVARSTGKISDQVLLAIIAQVSGVIIVILKYQWDLKKAMNNSEKLSAEVCRRFDERSDWIHTTLKQLEAILQNQADMFASINREIAGFKAELAKRRSEESK